jgi:hypothetical protein
MISPMEEVEADLMAGVLVEAIINKWLFQRNQ